MNSTQCLLFRCPSRLNSSVAIFLLWSALGTGFAAALPGARPEIHAADYPSLQAAFDALPQQGGVVRLPPGTFEIDRPLVVSRSDVLIQGAGTATHIKNINRSGMPALLVQHPDGRKVREWNGHRAQGRTRLRH
ncbi:MAG: hypothetical protein HY735_03210 [Verrucomicrobia bacterium]|nr:hypothetical protein [Verrucomicrobiota bacterium]